MDGPFAQVAIVSIRSPEGSNSLISIQPSSDLPDPPSQTLADARAALLGVFRKEFDAAAIARDPVAISRFFKLFPAINCPSDGLAAYSDFVLDLVSRRAPPAVKSTLYPFFHMLLLILQELHRLPTILPLLPRCTSLLRGSSTNISRLSKNTMDLETCIL